jgi:putative AdoMet-dependent methyltransferase
LKSGGRFFLFDIVFLFPVEKHEEFISNWLSIMKEKAGEKMMEEPVIHVRDEFSIYDWILEKMIELTGFKIMHVAEEMPNTKAYICIKE